MKWGLLFTRKVVIQKGWDIGYDPLFLSQPRNCNGSFSYLSDQLLIYRIWHH